MARQIFLDTETTGTQTSQGDRIVEIGCVEMFDRVLTKKVYHQYINPERDIPEEVVKIHGIDNDRVKDEPVFSEIVTDFMDFIKGAELIMHNAPFDVGFIDHELSMLSAYHGVHLRDLCTITDSLQLAKQKYPGQKNNLDALSARLYVDNSHRTFHGALLDSEILAEVYLKLTGGQTSFSFDSSNSSVIGAGEDVRRMEQDNFKVIKADEQELKNHHKFMEKHGITGDF